MSKPDRSIMNCSIAGMLLTTLLLLPLSLWAQTDTDDGDPMPAPSLELDTSVRVFPPLKATEPLAPDGDRPLAEVPPVVQGPRFLEYLLPRLVKPSAPIDSISIEPLPEVPTVVSEPAEPIAPPPNIHLRITLDWYLNPQHAALLVAREKGMFLRRGLEVSLDIPADPTVPAKLLAAGRTDLAVGRQAQLHLLAHAGVPVMRIATLVAAPVSGLVLHGSAEKERLDLALEGLRIGYTDVDGRDVMLASLLSDVMGLANGLELVELEDVNYSVLDAMRRQRVDGVLTHHRYQLPRQLADEGVVTHVLPIEEFGVPLHDGLILMANRDQLNGKRDALRRLVSALEEAAAWIVNHPQEAWALMEAAEPALADQASRETWSHIVPRLSLQPAAVDKGRYLRLDNFMLDAGAIETAGSLERLAVDLGAATP